jgi:hypothetical protein
MSVFTPESLFRLKKNIDRTVIQKIEQPNAVKLQQIKKTLPVLWNDLVRREPSFNTMVHQILNDEVGLAELFSEIQITPKGSATMTQTEAVTQFIANAMVCLIIACGEYNALRLFERSPITVLLGLIHSVQYFLVPSKTNPYCEQFQVLTLAGVFSRLSKEMYPARYTHGLISLFSEFNIDEEILRPTFKECYNHFCIKNIEVH